MARPTTPLISRRAAVEAALALIDREGLEAFSIRKLGAELGVNGASLYHHFADKDEILTEVVRAVLVKIRIPTEQATWQEWFVQAARAYREAVLAHPNVAPLLLDRRPHMFGHQVINFTAEQLDAGGVPKELQLAVMDASEMLAFASALFTARQPADGGFGEIAPAHGALRAAVAENRLDAEATFDLMCRAFAAGLSAGLESVTALPARSGGRRT
jgi:TetR/AcrR family transcriptional regulator, tetracycline repressor protein